jgi:DNA adenine methylase
MKYFGGKQRISKPLTDYLNKQLKDGQAFYDLFCGGCNVITKIKGNRPLQANDIHKELIAMWKYVQSGGQLPDTITEEQYLDIKYDVYNRYTSWLKGFVGFGCSFSGKWWGGYARGGEGRDYCKNAKNSTLKKAKHLSNVYFSCMPYYAVEIEYPNSMLYCDIPYKNTTGYSTGQFNHELFYAWAKEKAMQGHTVMVSEYENNVPDGWNVVWRYESKKDVRDNNGVQQQTVEILMTPVV